MRRAGPLRPPRGRPPCPWRGRPDEVSRGGAGRGPSRPAPGRGGRRRFRGAVRDAALLAMERGENVFLIGVGIVDPRAVWGTLAGALEKFGPQRVVEGPLAENALTG